jgi:hypothetical protein
METGLSRIKILLRTLQINCSSRSTGGGLGKKIVPNSSRAKEAEAQNIEKKC